MIRTPEYIDYLRQVREKQYNLHLSMLSENPIHEVGKTYFDGYWRKTYKVLDFQDNIGGWMGWCVTVLWQDGSITTHCTALNRNEDFLVKDDAECLSKVM